MGQICNDQLYTIGYQHIATLHYTSSYIYLVAANKHVNIQPLGFAITLAGAILFSTKAIIVKKAFYGTQADALSLLTLRMIFSLPFYVAVALLQTRKSDNVRFTNRQWWYILGLGLLGYYLSSLFDFLGLQYISAGLERLILFLYPTFTVFINALFFGQKIKKLQRWALVLTYTGIAIAYFGELKFDTGNPHFGLGCLLVLLCAITYSVYIAGSGRIIPKVGAAKFTAYAMLAATGGIFIHFALANNYGVFTAGANLWWYGLLLALVATVIPSFLISMGLQKIGANNVAIVSGIGPVSTIVQAHLVLGEPIFAAQICGTLLVVAGVLLIGWKRPTPTETE